MTVAPPTGAGADTLAEAECYLLGLEQFGMRFGTERVQLLLRALDLPQTRFASVHVVGSNGKSSTTRMIAALLAAHGVRAGSYLSPHLVTFTERVRVDGRDIGPERFAAAVDATRRAATELDRTRPGDDHVTQFEALTASAFLALAEAGVDVAVVEAGLGGRWDATNVIGSAVQVLTNVSLEHTRWLGATHAAIAEEKLDVVRPGGTLVIGPELHPDARTVAERVAAERGARLVVAPPGPPAGLRLAAAGAFQRTNFALACAAAEAFLATAGSPGPSGEDVEDAPRGEPRLATRLDPATVARVAAATLVPGRLETVAQRPLTLFDGAHNLAGFTALAASLPELLAGRRLVAVVCVLDDKDAAAMLAVLLPLCAEVIATDCAHPRTLPAATLAGLGERPTPEGPSVRIEPDPHRALARARELARPDGVVLATGSLYLLADLLRPAGAGPGSTR